MSNSAYLMLLATTAVVDNLAEKIDKYLLLRSLSIFCIQLGLRKQSIVQSSWVSIMGCLSIKVNGRTVETFRIVRYIVGIWCPLSGVPL